MLKTIPGILLGLRTLEYPVTLAPHRGHGPGVLGTSFPHPKHLTRSMSRFLFPASMRGHCIPFWNIPFPGLRRRRNSLSRHFEIHRNSLSTVEARGAFKDHGWPNASTAGIEAWSQAVVYFKNGERPNRNKRCYVHRLVSRHGNRPGARIPSDRREERSARDPIPQ